LDKTNAANPAHLGIWA